MIAWWQAALLALAVGSVIGGALYVLLAENVRIRATAEARAQLRLEYGLHPAVFEGCNPRETPMPRGRHRSPDTQLVARTEPGRVTWPAFEDR